MNSYWFDHKIKYWVLGCEQLFHGWWRSKETQGQSWIKLYGASLIIIIIIIHQRIDSSYQMIQQLEAIYHPRKSIQQHFHLLSPNRKKKRKLKLKIRDPGLAGRCGNSKLLRVLETAAVSGCMAPSNKYGIGFQNNVSICNTR